MKALVLLLLLATPVVAADKPLKKSEFNFKLRGCAVGYSKQVEGFGGNATSSNLPKPAPEDLLTKKALLLAFDPTARPFEDTYEGLTLRLVNASSNEVILNACDSRLPLVQEAQDQSGHWKELNCGPAAIAGTAITPCI